MSISVNMTGKTKTHSIISSATFTQLNRLLPADEHAQASQSVYTETPAESFFHRSVFHCLKWAHTLNAVDRPVLAELLQVPPQYCHARPTTVPHHTITQCIHTTRRSISSQWILTKSSIAGGAPQNCHFPRGSGPQVHTPNGIMIGLAILAQLMVKSN